MTTEEKVIDAVKKHVNADVDINGQSRLREDLGLESANLLELTTQLKAEYGVDLQQKAAQKNIVPATVADVAALMQAS